MNVLPLLSELKGCLHFAFPPCERPSECRHRVRAKATPCQPPTPLLLQTDLSTMCGLSSSPSKEPRLPFSGFPLSTRNANLAFPVFTPLYCSEHNDTPTGRKDTLTPTVTVSDKRNIVEIRANMCFYVRETLTNQINTSGWYSYSLRSTWDQLCRSLTCERGTQRSRVSNSGSRCDTD